MIKGVIFDFDGTLYDSMPIWDRLPFLYLERHGIQAPADISERLKTMTTEESAAYFIDAYGIDTDIPSAIREFNDILAEFYRQEVQPKEGVRELLSALQERNIRMAIATATDAELIHAALERCRLASFFAFVITCSEAGVGKTEPVIYRMAQQRMNLKKEETAVVEDALHAAVTAVSDGYYTVGIHDPSETEQERLRRICSDYLISFSEKDAIERILHL